MKPAAAIGLLLGGMIAATGAQLPGQAQAQLRVLPESPGGAPGSETVTTATCMLAIMAAAAVMQRDFNLQQWSAGTRLDFDEAFLRHYGSIACYEDADGFILYFRPHGHVGGGGARGSYMVRMARDHAIQYAAPLR